MIVKIIPKIKLPLGANSVFDYLVPKEMESKIKLGQIVEVEFRNLKVEGMVTETQKHKNTKTQKQAFTLKPIIRILDESPVFYEKQIEVLKWISEYYFTPLSNALRMFAPDVPRIKTQKHKSTKANEFSEFKLAVLKSRLGAIEKAIEEIKNAKSDVVFQWNDLKEKILVYIKLVEYYICKNQQVLILLPQISDIEFLSKHLQSKFASKIAIIHGGLGKIEMYTAWDRIRKNQAKIILGTRSAVLAPMKNPGLIIIDNEESSDHKQYDMNPRYDARRIVERLGIKTVFASSAPRVETHFKIQDARDNNQINSSPQFDRVEAGKPQIQDSKCELVKLIRQKIDVGLVDMANELRRGKYSPISRSMEKSMRESLEHGKKAILFLNRRGVSTMTMCGGCKFVFKCAKCDLPLVYNSDAQQLVCHSCGFKQDTPLFCPKCKSANIKFVGTGTQRIEHEVRKLFPDLPRLASFDSIIKSRRASGKAGKKIIRIDKDAQYYKIDIEKYDIIIGTQLLLKDFKAINNVGFLGIVSLDIMLSRPDFRTSEKFYQTVSLILGWARFNRIDKILWQTFLFENELINISARQDYDNFFKRELLSRKEFYYPPFCKLVKFIYKHANQKRALSEAQKLINNLRDLDLDGTQAVGPVEPFVKIIRKNYVELVILKTVDLEVLKKIPADILKGWFLDVEPEGLS